MFERKQLTEGARARASLAYAILQEWDGQAVGLGAVALGGELGAEPRDSVWWVPAHGTRYQIAPDLSRWKDACQERMHANDLPDPWWERTIHALGVGLAALGIVAAIAVQVIPGIGQVVGVIVGAAAGGLAEAGRQLSTVGPDVEWGQVLEAAVDSGFQAAGDAMDDNGNDTGDTGDTGDGFDWGQAAEDAWGWFKEEVIRDSGAKPPVDSSARPAGGAADTDLLGLALLAGAAVVLVYVVRR